MAVPEFRRRAKYFDCGYKSGAIQVVPVSWRLLAGEPIKFMSSVNLRSDDWSDIQANMMLTL